MDKLIIKILSHDHDIMNTRLEFSISVNNAVVNTLRRVILSRIPIYSFNKITITENTSIFNNNYMKLRIKNMSVIGITADDPIYVEKVKDTSVEDEEAVDDIDMNVDEQVNSSSLKQLTMYVDAINNTSDIITIFTNDCKFYFAEKQIDSPYKINIPLIKLQPKQKIKMSAITELGIEDINSIYSAVSIATFTMKSENEYNFVLESRGQLDEKIIIKYAVANINNILDNFIKSVPSVKSINGKMLVEKADHTIGALIAAGLQTHPDIKFAGYNMPHLLDPKIMLHYELNNEKHDIRDIMADVVDKYKKIFKKISDAMN